MTKKQTEAEPEAPAVEEHGPTQEAEAPASEFSALLAKNRSQDRQRMTAPDLDLATRMTLMYGRGPKKRGPYVEEIEHYLHCIRKYNLDPMQRQICAVWRFDKNANDEVMTVQTQIDGYRVIAARTGEYAGSDEAIYEYDDAGKIVKCTKTVWRIVKNTRCPFTATAYWKEYKPGGGGGFMWDRMEHCMIAKCAEALALRMAFPADLGGLYVDAEMEQSQVAPPADAPDAAPDAPRALTRKQRQNPAPATIETAWAKWLGLATARRDAGDVQWADLDAKKAPWFKAYMASVLGRDVPNPRELPKEDVAVVIADLDANADPRNLDERSEA